MHIKSFFMSLGCKVTIYEVEIEIKRMFLLSSYENLAITCSFTPPSVLVDINLKSVYPHD